MLPATKEWIDVKSHFEKMNSTEDFVPAFAEFTKNTVCVLEFEEQLPIWSACNALDNGQLGKGPVQNFTFLIILWDLLFASKNVENRAKKVHAH